MYSQGENPLEPQGTPPADPGDQQLFTQLYHGDQAGPNDAEDDAEAEAERKRRSQGIVAANSSIAVSAGTGSAAAGAVILAGQSGAVAGGAGAGGAAGASGGALASGATVVKSGLGLKLIAGGIAGVVVVSGVVVGVTVMSRDSVGNEAAPIEQAAMDKSIEKFDFDNVAFTDEFDTEFQLTDGHFQPPDATSDTEGYFLTGTEFADVDGDNDLDAATLLEWHPGAGHTTSYVYLWLWDGDKAEQVEYPITNGYYSDVGGLKAVKDGFTIDTTARPPDISSTNEPVTETITIGYKDGFPVQTKPVFGSADRCPEFRDYPATGPYPDVIPKVAPDDDAPDIGKAADIKAVYAVWTDRGQAFSSEWMTARVERADGEISCGWIPADSTG